MSENVIVRYSQFFQDDGGLKKTKEDFYKLGDDLIKKAEEVRKRTKLISDTDTKSIDDLMNKTSQLTEARKKHAELLKKIEGLQKKEASTRKKTTKAITAESEALKKRNREARLIAKIQNTVTGSIENMRAKLSLVTVAWSKLTAKELENTARGRRLVESKKKLTAELKRLERATGDNRRNVGNYSSALGRLRGSLVSVAQAAGVTLGIFGAFRLIKNATSIIKDFEKQNATLASVLQVEKSEIQELVEDSKRLGSITVKTAGEVAGLQTEYARLGFTQKEILNLTEPTINGSIALNSELSATSQLVGAVVNSYDGLSASDAPAIIDTLALSTAKSALNFEKLSTGLPIVLGAANALNIPLTEVTATLGKLADAGIDTSSGATSLRNIFIEASARGINYKDALEEVKNSTDKLKTANDLFGKRAAVSALVIANNTEGVEELDKALQNASGTAEEMAKKELATLDGSIKLLTSAWEGYVLKLNDSTNGGNILSDSIRFLADNLVSIIKVITIATSTYLAYTLAMKASNVAKKIGIAFDRVSTLVTNLRTSSTIAATAAQKAFNRAVKANILGVLIALLAAAVTAYYAFRDSVTASERAQKQFNKSKKDAFKEETERIKVEDEITNKRVKNLKFEIALRKKKGESSEKLDKEFIERKKGILKEEISSNQKLINEDLKRKKVFDGIIKDTENKFAKQEKTASNTALFKTSLGGLKTQQGLIVGQIEARNAKISQLDEALKNIDKDLTLQLAENTKSAKKAIADRVRELEILRRRLEDLQDGSIKNEEKREIQQTNRKFNREIKAIKGNSQVEIDLRKALEIEKQRQINDTRQKYQNERLDSIQRIQDIENSFLKDDIERQIAIEKEKSAKLIDEISKNKNISIQKRLELIKKEEDRVTDFSNDLRFKNSLKELEDEKAISDALIDQKRGEFDKQEDFEKFKNAELIKIQRKYLNDRLKLLVNSGSDAFKVEIEQIKAQLANLGIEPPPIDPWQKFARDLKETLVLASVEIEKALQKALEASKTSLSEQQKAVDTQKSRAEKGLTNTLAFEQKQLAKREADVIKRQKRLDRVQKVKSYWNTYNANVSALKEGEDSGKAITKTLRDIGTVEALTASVASFGDGGIVGIDGHVGNNGVTRGGSHASGNDVLARFEGGEGFLSRKEMGNIGYENFYKFKNMASTGVLDTNFFTGQNDTLKASMTSINYVSDPRLVSEMKSVRNAIESIPSQAIDMPAVVGKVLKFTETVKEKGQVKRNHYAIKKPRL